MQMKLILSALLALAVGISPSVCEEKLIFSDDFDQLDMDKWKHELSMGGGGNWEFQMYVNNRQNSFVKDGKLHIQPTLTVDQPGNKGDDAILFTGRQDMWGTNPADICTSNQDYGCMRMGTPTDIINPVRSARLRTAESFSFKYGRVEIKAKLPKGDWIWPALWMLPATNPFGSWPASGEIDIMESRGNVNDKQGFNVGSYMSTLHWGPSFKDNGYPLTGSAFYLTDGCDLSQDFHTYGLYWDEQQMYTYIDDPSQRVMDLSFNTSFADRAKEGGFNWDFDPYTPTGSNAAPFDQQFYLIMNVAVGGTNGYFPDDVPGKPWQNGQPHGPLNFWNARNAWYPTWKESSAMVIDSVKVWAVEGTEYTYHGAYADKLNHERNKAEGKLTVMQVEQDTTPTERVSNHYAIENSSLSIFNITLISLNAVLICAVCGITYMLFKSKRSILSKSDSNDSLREQL